MKSTPVFLPTMAVFFALGACTKQGTVEAPKFDPKYVAVEADKGNLGPLKELNAACRTEVEKIGNGQ